MHFPEGALCSSLNDLENLFRIFEGGRPKAARPFVVACIRSSVRAQARPSPHPPGAARRSAVPASCDRTARMRVRPVQCAVG